MTYKTKEPVILPAKWVYLGIAEKLQFGTSQLWRAISKSKEQREAWSYRGEKGSWERLFGRVQRGNGFSLAECGSFLLAQLYPGAQTWRKAAKAAQALMEVFCWARRNSCFLLLWCHPVWDLGGIVWQPSLQGSQLHFKWGFLYLFLITLTLKVCFRFMWNTSDVSEFLPWTWWLQAHPFSSILHCHGPQDHACDTLVPMSKLHPHSPKMSAFLTTGQAQECTGREWSTFT